MTNLSATSFISQTFALTLTDNTFVILKTPCCDSWDIQGQSLSRGFKAFSCTTLLPGLGAHICLATFQYALGAISWEFNCTPIPILVIKILKEYCAWFCKAIWLNLFLLLYCFVNLISKSASQGEGCCIIVENSIRPEVVLQPRIVFLHQRVSPEWV